MVFGKHFFKYYFKYFIYFFIGIATLVVVNYIQLEIPALLSKIITILEEYSKGISDQTDNINPMILEILMIGGIIVVGRFIWRYTIFGASRKIEYEIRNKMFLKATKLSTDYYHHEKVGALMTYFINDLEAVRMAYGPGILTIVDSLVLGGFALHRMYRLSHTLTLYALIPIGALFIIMFALSKNMQRRFKDRQQKFEAMSDFTQENFSGITVIKAYVKEAKESMLFRKKSIDLYDSNMSFIKTVVKVQIAIGLAINLVILLIISYGGYVVIKGDLLTGDLTAYLSYFFTLIWPVMALNRFIMISSQAKASSKRIAAFLNQKITVKDYQTEEEILLDGSIQAKALSFKYPDGDTNVLNQVSFDIQAGEMVGILGKTGSGKSSLVELILRLYNVEENELFIGGHDIMKVPIKTIRNHIGYVPQDNFLYSDTIKNNIGFAYEQVEDDVVEHAAKESDVYDNIMAFKEQFETVLGERGVTVSGGQKQRISIARAIAKDPSILILDDSVSAVDTKTEEAIIKNLKRIRKHKTTILIAHRISTVKEMDKIILLDQGSIVAVGTHEALLKESPLYQEMVRLQTLESMIQGGELV